MANTGVEYTITVNKTGAGAAQAIVDFQSVQAQANSTTTAMGALAQANTTLATGAAKTSQNVTHTSNSIRTLKENTKIAHEAFRALDGTLRVIGFSTFPQVTLAVTAAVDGMRALSSVAKNAMAGAGGVGGLRALAPVAGAAAGWAAIVAAIGATAYSVYDLTQATNHMSDAMEKNDAVLEATAQRWRDDINQAVHDGNLELTEYQRNLARINLETPTAEGLRQVKSQIMDRMPGNFFLSEAEKNSIAGERIGDLQRSTAHSDAAMAFNNPNSGSNKDFQKLQIQMQYNDQVKLYNSLVAEGIMTEDKARNASIEADTNRMNSLVQLREQLTEVQQLGQESVKMFSAGFANAFVEFASGTKKAGEAFRDFASSFLSSIAQMIMQQMIFNMIKNSSLGSWLGMANGGVAFAASGGMFPRFAANGLAGVSSVSSPTYFPKFNVVAGEAGREMLTVLARPRMMEVGGMQAVVGSAQGRQLAITSANDLARGGAGGTILIQVMGTPDFEARLVSNSVKGAVVQVANDMRQDTPIARGVKGLAA